MFVEHGYISTPLILSRLFHEIRMEWSPEGKGHESDLSFLLEFLGRASSVGRDKVWSYVNPSYTLTALPGCKGGRVTWRRRPCEWVNLSFDFLEKEIQLRERSVAFVHVVASSTEEEPTKNNTICGCIARRHQSHMPSSVLCAISLIVLTGVTIWLNILTLNAGK